MSVSAEVQEDLGSSSGTEEGEWDRQGEEGSPRTLLSTTQLILRRGLTVLAAMVILAVGTSVHLLMPPPDAYTLSEGNLTVDWTNTSYPPEPVQSTLLI